MPPVDPDALDPFAFDDEDDDDLVAARITPRRHPAPAEDDEPPSWDQMIPGPRQAEEPDEAAGPADSDESGSPPPQDTADDELDDLDAIEPAQRYVLDDPEAQDPVPSAEPAAEPHDEAASATPFAPADQELERGESASVPDDALDDALDDVAGDARDGGGAVAPPADESAAEDATPQVAAPSPPPQGPDWWTWDEPDADIDVPRPVATAPSAPASIDQVVGDDIPVADTADGGTPWMDDAETAFEAAPVAAAPTVPEPPAPETSPSDDGPPPAAVDRPSPGARPFAPGAVPPGSLAPPRPTAPAPAAPAPSQPATAATSTQQQAPQLAPTAPAPAAPSTVGVPGAPGPSGRTRALRNVVARALAEDLGDRGDVTTRATVSASARGVANVTARAAGTIAGTSAMVEAFAQIDPRVEVEVHAWDGQSVAAGDVIATVRGPLRAILTGERVALNLLSHLSGIATETRAYVEALHGTACTVRDTRKTTPGLRELEKAAVRSGGGTNHRIGLFDGVLVKDNHVAAAGGVAAATKAALARAEGLPVQIEVDSLAQLREALDAGATDVLLDNFSPDEVRQAVAGVGGQARLEASGGITLDNVRAFAEAGADTVSVGAITHSAATLDVALDLTDIAGPGTPAAAAAPTSDAAPRPAPAG